MHFLQHKFFKTLLDQTFGVFSMDKFFSEIWEGVQGWYKTNKSVDGIFQKISTTVYQRILAPGQ
eukprot:UN28207